MKRNEKTERNRLIYKARTEGMTQKKIAEQFGISICRVRQIIEAEDFKAINRAREAE